jgi:hypothetical protein
MPPFEETVASQGTSQAYCCRTVALSFRDVLISFSSDPSPYPAVTIQDFLTNPYAIIAEGITPRFKDTQVGNLCARFAG